MHTLTPSMTILYVDAPLRSADFYTQLLGRPPVESSPGFAMFVFDNGLKLGLWSRHGVEPAPVHTSGGSVELAMAVHSPDAVHALHEDWKAHGLPIAQPVTDMDFGLTFVALDPDGHRLRVYAPRPE